MSKNEIPTSFAIHRRRAPRRCSASGFHVLCPQSRVLRLIRQLGDDLAACFRLIEQLLQKRPAPATTRPRAKAIGKLPHALRFLDSQVVHHLALRDMKAKAQFVVGLHDVVNFLG